MPSLGLNGNDVAHILQMKMAATGHDIDRVLSLML